MKKTALSIALVLALGCNKKESASTEPAEKPEQEVATWQFSIENQTEGVLSIAGEETIDIAAGQRGCLLEACSTEEWEQREFTMSVDGEAVSSEIFKLEHWTLADGEQEYVLSVTPMLVKSFEVHLE